MCVFIFQTSNDDYTEDNNWRMNYDDGYEYAPSINRNKNRSSMYNDNQGRYQGR